MRVQVNSRMDYMAFYKSISKVILDDANELILELLSDFGEGTVHMIRISDYLNLVKLNVTVNEDLSLDYVLPNEHFEISCCLDGHADISGPTHDHISIVKDSVLLSYFNNDSAYISGIMKLSKGVPFHNISFSFDKDVYNEYHKGISDLLWTEHFFERQLKDKCVYLAGQLPHVKNLFQSIFNTNFNQMSLKGLFIEGKIIEIITEVVHSSNREKSELMLSEDEKQCIHEIPRLMLENPVNPPTIDQLANDLCLSKNKLKNGFKLLYGDTIYNYFKKMKMQNAAVLIKTTDKTMLEIAEAVGYHSQSQFGVAFKNHYGMTPLAYAKSAYDILG